MFLSKLNAMSTGPLWVLRDRQDAKVEAAPDQEQESTTQQNMACCAVCGAPWLQTALEKSSIVAIFASPIIDAAQQKLVENCLRAAGWSPQSTRFSLHEACSSISQTALLALQEHIAAHAPEYIVVFGHKAAQLLHPEFIPGQLNQYAGTRLIGTHHPEEMMRNPALKAQVWADFCLAKLSS